MRNSVNANINLPKCQERSKTPDLYERERIVVTRSKFVLAEGPLQSQDGVIYVKASHLSALSDHALELRSHDFQ
jgi:error-prone DNA polymerase